MVERLQAAWKTMCKTENANICNKKSQKCSIYQTWDAEKCLCERKEYCKKGCPEG